MIVEIFVSIRCAVVEVKRNSKAKLEEPKEIEILKCQVKRECQKTFFARRKSRKICRNLRKKVLKKFIIFEKINTN